jgi:hypothetical protein
MANGTTSRRASRSRTPFGESFDGRRRDKCCNETLVTSRAHARSILAAWKLDYNAVMPRSKTGNRPAAEIADQRALRHAINQRPLKQKTLLPYCTNQECASARTADHRIIMEPAHLILRVLVLQFFGGSCVDKLSTVNNDGATVARAVFFIFNGR